MLAAAVHLVELVGHQQRRDAGLEQRQHLGVGQREVARLDHEQHQVDVAHRAQSRSCSASGSARCRGGSGSPACRRRRTASRPRVRMPVMRWRVVCALREVMLIFWPTSALSSVDLPTLGLPTMATRPQRCAGASAPARLRRRLATGVRGRSGSFQPRLSEPAAWPPRRPARRPGARRRCRARPGPVRRPRTRRRRSACAPRPACRPRGRPAASSCGPAAIPAARSWGPWRRPACAGLISTVSNRRCTSASAAA